MKSDRITAKELKDLADALAPLKDVQFNVLQLPMDVLIGFEPSQIGTVVGVLMDACIPQLDVILGEETFKSVGLKKHAGVFKDREGYPDFLHSSGRRLELKLLYVDPVGVDIKKPSTPREPSARLTQKVTVKNVEPAKDALLVIAYQLQPTPKNLEIYAPTIIDIGVFSMIECIEARDLRLTEAGGKWFGNYETPAVLSKKGKGKKEKGKALNTKRYGRKESEGHDYNEDTNFGKLARVPYKPLKDFLKKHGKQAVKADADVSDNSLEELEEAASQ